MNFKYFLLNKDWDMRATMVGKTKECSKLLFEMDDMFFFFF